MTQEAPEYSTKRALTMCAAGQVMMVAGAAIRGGTESWVLALFPLPVAAFVLLRSRIRRRS